MFYKYKTSLKENENVNTTFCGVLWCCAGSQCPDDQKCGEKACVKAGWEWYCFWLMMKRTKRELYILIFNYRMHVSREEGTSCTALSQTQHPWGEWQFCNWLLVFAGFNPLLYPKYTEAFEYVEVSVSVFLLEI